MREVRIVSSVGILLLAWGESNNFEDKLVLAVYFSASCDGLFKSKLFVLLLLCQIEMIVLHAVTWRIL